jgi:hypothetical protein
MIMFYLKLEIRHGYLIKHHHHEEGASRACKFYNIKKIMLISVFVTLVNEIKKENFTLKLTIFIF